MAERELDIILENLERATQDPHICVEELELLIEEGNRKCEEGNVAAPFLAQMTAIIKEQRESRSPSYRFQAERVCTVGRGRPTVQIHSEQLVEFHKNGFTGAQMARHFNCSRIVYQHLKQAGLQLRSRFTDITDEQLDMLPKFTKKFNLELSNNKINQHTCDPAFGYDFLMS